MGTRRGTRFSRTLLPFESPFCPRQRQSGTATPKDHCDRDREQQDLEDAVVASQRDTVNMRLGMCCSNVRSCAPCVRGVCSWEEKLNSPNCNDNYNPRCTNQPRVGLLVKSQNISKRKRKTCYNSSGEMCRQVIALHLYVARGDGKGDGRTSKSVHAPTAKETLVGQRSQALRVSRVWLDHQTTASRSTRFSRPQRRAQKRDSVAQPSPPAENRNSSGCRKRFCLDRGRKQRNAFSPT